MKEEIFISTMAILLFFNIFVTFANPDAYNVLDLEFTDIMITVVGILLTGGLASVLVDGVIVTKGIAIMIIFNVLFRINVGDFNIGFGLVNTVFNVFNTYDVMGIGYLIASILGVMAFFSGMLIVVESG